MKIRRSVLAFLYLALAATLLCSPTLAFADDPSAPSPADQVSGTSPADVPMSDATASSRADVLADQLSGDSPAGVLGAEGAPAGDLLSESPEDAASQGEPQADAPSCEEAAEISALDGTADSDDVDGSGDSQGGHSAAAPSAARTSDCESPEATADEAADDAESPLLLAAEPKATYAAASAGWNKVNGVYYWYAKKGDTTPAKGWLVTGQRLSGGTGGLQRYWLDSKTGALAMGKLVNTGSGVWTYARSEGYVARGKFTNPDNGYVYLANNDGRLEPVGWVVSSAYGDGLQRYWIDKSKHAAIPGYSSAGWAHYTRPEGYVARGKYVHPDTGYVYLANNDGKLELGGTGSGGWLVTNKYDGGHQRYWIDPKAHAAIPGYSTAGWSHYTHPEKGFVARGSFTDTYGRSCAADNNGKLTQSRPVWNGWVVTSVFGQGLQRYWFKNDKMVTDTLLTAKQAGWWAYARPEGYVVRGKYVHPDTGYVYLADNDGKLENPGWLVTNKYTGSTQRYWIDSKAHAAVPGYSEGGWAHYTLPETGYVARNQDYYVNDGWYHADNDGRLKRTSPKVADVIEAYIKWALDTAADDTHGYSQLDRWGPDYDCSSFVVSSLKAIGLKVGYASWTGNMKGELIKYGWTWITDISKRTRGDILLNITSHTEIYLGDGENVGAHYDENGSIGYGAKTGDQTKHEICKGSYWNDNWDGILRLERIV